MSAYKKLNKQDAYITTYTAHKNWAVSASDFSSYGIKAFTATGSYLNSLQQLYYPSKSLGEIVSHSYDYYNQTTLNFSQSRNITESPYVVSIPRELYGTCIQPGIGIDVTINDVQQSRYVSSSYWSGSYTNDPEVIVGLTTISFGDDGEGNVYVSGSSPRRYVGDIIYPHGMIIITDVEYAYLLGIKPVDTLTFKSSVPIYTHNYHCKLKETDYNSTYNPTALTSSIRPTYYSDGELYSSSSKVSLGDRNNLVTGSDFQPYITTVGLYNDANELIAVGKIGQPVPKSANTEMVFIVKIDI